MKDSLETTDLDEQREARPSRVVLARPEASQPPLQLAQWIARAGLDKKATGVHIIDVRGRVDYADYLVLLTGGSDRHVAAIGRGIDAELSRKGARCLSLEGLPQASWVLIDFVDVVAHVFQEESRALYDLDGLWMDAPRIPILGTVEARP